jgi:hypothetical protein
MGPRRNAAQLASWLCLLCSHSSVSARVLQHPAAAKESYDYIIAGGGLTGLVVANRLTEDSKSELALLPDSNMA